MKIHQTFRLEEETIKSAKEYSKKENRSLSNVYAIAVKEYLERRKETNKEVKIC